MTVKNSYSKASVRCTTGGSCGGLFGYFYSTPMDVYNSYSSSFVTASANAGNIIGGISFSRVSLDQVYFNNQTTPFYLRAGLATEQLQTGLMLKGSIVLNCGAQSTSPSTRKTFGEEID